MGPVDTGGQGSLDGSEVKPVNILGTRRCRDGRVPRCSNYRAVSSSAFEVPHRADAGTCDGVWDEEMFAQAVRSGECELRCQDFVRPFVRKLRPELDGKVWQLFKVRRLIQT